MSKNPISGDEGKWTPRSIFDIDLGNIPLPKRSIFSQGGDGVDVEKAQESLVQGSSSFFNNFFDKVQDSVTEQIGPTYDAIAETKRRQEELAEAMSESTAAQEAILEESQEVLAKAEEAAQSLEGVEAELEQAQNDLIAQGIRFDEEQSKINWLIQEMIWSQADLMDEVSIRSTKTYGWLYSEISSNPKEPIPGQTRPSWPTVETPYFTLWCEGDRGLYIATVPGWGGEMRLLVNWDNGKIDLWSPSVPLTGMVYYFEGGSLGMNIRSFSVDVLANQRNRSVVLVPPDAIPNGYDQIPEGAPENSMAIPDWSEKDLVREIKYINGQQIIRFKAPAVCNFPVYVMEGWGEERTIETGEVIPAGAWVIASHEKNWESWMGPTSNGEFVTFDESSVFVDREAPWGAPARTTEVGMVSHKV